MDIFSEVAGRVVTNIYRLGWTVKTAHMIAVGPAEVGVGGYLTVVGPIAHLHGSLELSLNIGITTFAYKIGS